MGDEGRGREEGGVEGGWSGRDDQVGLGHACDWLCVAYVLLREG
jgi:hypothetical protein